MLIGDFIDLFRQGKAVADPAKWKAVGVTTDAVAAFLTTALAIASAFGYRVDVAGDLVQAVAAGLAALLFVFSGGLHIATSEKVGVLPAKADGAGNDSLSSNGVGADPAAVREFLDQGR